MSAETAMKEVVRVWALIKSVYDLVLGGQRNAEEVCDVLQVIKDDKNFAMTIGLKTMSELVKKQLVSWEQLYREEFGIALDTSKIKIPAYRNGWNRLIVVAEGLTPEKIYRAMKKKMPAWKYLDNLNMVESVRKTDKTYVVWVRDRQEADEELNNKSANDLRGDGTNCITLEERLLHGMMYFRETGNHLDIHGVTLCAGSHGVDGDVPNVDWSGDKVRVGWCALTRAYSDQRGRSVVS